MTKTIDYFYSLTSPWTFLGHRRLLSLAASVGASINFMPCNLGVVFQVSGGLPLPKRAPQRVANRMAELKRWRDYLGIPINVEPKFFPVDATEATLLVIAANASGEDVGVLSEGILRAVWIEERNIADREVLSVIADEQGMNGAALLEKAASAEVTAQFEANTKAAVDANVFGAPTYIIDGDLFWGQDRLDFVERALAG
jgi:2-hydroxychromene-2-carboxylate isomerase